jgi:hypothetical protein
LGGALAFVSLRVKQGWVHPAEMAQMRGYRNHCRQLLTMNTDANVLVTSEPRQDAVVAIHSFPEH